ncbi:hypothetical protein [Moritella sp. 28]|uniref:hypothetical protein n=1 Tax=Moritella sp. 28 TaxID=2746232 RepID=UPI001BABA7BE|nr:hypothetical protein [Moritella sp. 28]QUM85971.1 hypothetical protein HWV02_16370 [Moritella sp. 28]
MAVTDVEYVCELFNNFEWMTNWKLNIMWVIISQSRQLKFYGLTNSEQAIEIDGISYFIEKKGYSPEIKFDHNFAVEKLLLSGVPLFITKSDARKEAVKLGLTGFKYLNLSPSIIKLT